MLISLIIPVYNVEKYLSKCLDSLIQQTYGNIEIICINDGSTDNSLQILENYANKDCRIKIINQQNQGVSVARNVGIDNATGEYILFIDSDDWLELDAIKILYKNVKNTNIDILSFNFNMITKNYIKKVFAPLNNNNKFLIQDWGLWNRAYRKSFLKENNIKFPNGINISEDMIFLFNCIIAKPSLKFIQNQLYNYRFDREGSATKNYKDFLQNNILAYEYMLKMKFYQNTTLSEQLYILDMWARSVFNCWSSLPNKYRNKDADFLIKNFIKYFYNFKYNDFSKLIGYKRLKYKKIIFILKQIRDLYFSIIYRSKNV